jgi:hypothetical protein
MTADEYEMVETFTALLAAAIKPKGTAMKFSNLTANHRSILAALVNAGPQTTDRLARVIGTTSAQVAASSLCQLRTIGLIYSREKGVDTYATWVANDIGLAVFNNRPADVPAPAIEPQCASNDVEADWLLTCCSSAALPYSFRATRTHAMCKLQTTATNNPGVTYNLYRVIAQAAMPVPQAQITLL